MSVEVIAIDGPAASGKSTVAKLLAKRLGIAYINSGNMYRAVTLTAMNSLPDSKILSEDSLTPVLEKLSLEYVKNPATGLFELNIDGKFIESKLRSPEVAKLVSAVAALGNVRQWINSQLRDFTSLGMIVIEGRDIGSAVFPDARYKFFLTATPEARARRRLAQEGETFSDDTLESVAASIAERDYLDSHREIAPLCQAEGAFSIDSSDKTVDQVIDIILEKIHEKI